MVLAPVLKNENASGIEDWFKLRDPFNSIGAAPEYPMFDDPLTSMGAALADAQ